MVSLALVLVEQRGHVAVLLVDTLVFAGAWEVHEILAGDEMAALLDCR